MMAVIWMQTVLPGRASILGWQIQQGITTCQPVGSRFSKPAQSATRYADKKKGKYTALITKHALKMKLEFAVCMFEVSSGFSKSALILLKKAADMADKNKVRLKTGGNERSSARKTQAGIKRSGLSTEREERGRKRQKVQQTEAQQEEREIKEGESDPFRVPPPRQLCLCIGTIMHVRTGGRHRQSKLKSRIQTQA